MRESAMPQDDAALERNAAYYRRFCGGAVRSRSVPHPTAMPSGVLQLAGAAIPIRPV
jgi:hypothetical protein